MWSSQSAKTSFWVACVNKFGSNEGWSSNLGNVSKNIRLLAVAITTHIPLGKFALRTKYWPMMCLSCMADFKFDYFKNYKKFTHS